MALYKNSLDFVSYINMGDIMKHYINRIINKEVINVKDGSRLGRVCDVCVDIKCGVITALIVPVVRNIFSFVGKKKEYFINWEYVVKVGEDIILIDTDVSKCVKICEQEENKAKE